jgi:hypothetical protein
MNNKGFRICVVNENANVTKFREILGVRGSDFSLFMVFLNPSRQIPELSLKLGHDHFHHTHSKTNLTLIESFDAILIKLQCC